MRRTSITATFWVILVAALPLSLFAQGPRRIASRMGEAVVGGDRVIVHVVVAVPPGMDANSVAEDAVRGQGARPLAADFVASGLSWDQFFNESLADDKVTQYYNSAGEVVDAYASLQAAQATWNAVPTSKFSFEDGGATSRCPSLVRECAGPQYYDDFNDVGWLPIGGCCTLGVTWYSTVDDEADMALNSRMPWTTGGGSGYDVQTVILHENGHVLGLDHSAVNGAVMEAYYEGERRNLHEDDQRGVTYLYPAPDGTGAISGNVSSAGGGPIAGARVSVANSPISATTDASGNYTLASVPDIGLYDVTATATGFKSQTLLSDVPNAALDFSLEAGGGGGGGKCNPRKPGCSN